MRILPSCYGRRRQIVESYAHLEQRVNRRLGGGSLGNDTHHECVTLLLTISPPEGSDNSAGYFLAAAATEISGFDKDELVPATVFAGALVVTMWSARVGVFPPVRSTIPEVTSAKAASTTTQECFISLPS